jgi:hypothetical protein
MSKKTIPAAFQRLAIVIDGVATRTVSAVDDLVRELRASGISDKVIKSRIETEIESGRVFSELRSFATARCPGFVGDMTFRFARDTLADRQRVIESLAEVRGKASGKRGGSSKESIAARTEVAGLVVERMQADITSAATPEDAARAEQILATYDESGIDITAFEGEELPEPPADADATDLYMWVAVEDKNTCDICAGNHGEVKTLAEWSNIGEPRSGACAGDQNCRCVLVPAGSLTDGEQTQIKDNGPITG